MTQRSRPTSRSSAAASSAPRRRCALRRMGLRVVLLERDLCGSRSSGVNYGGVRRQGRPLCAAAAVAARARASGAGCPS